MTNALQLKTSELPTDAATGLILPLSKSLGLQVLAQHRAMVALELEVLAKKHDRFGWDRDRNSPAHDRLITDWMDALQDYPLDEIQAACRAAILDNPRMMPNEGHIVAKINEARRVKVAAFKAALPKPREPERPQITEDDRARRAAFAASVLGGNRMVGIDGGDA